MCRLEFYNRIYKHFLCFHYFMVRLILWDIEGRNDRVSDGKISKYIKMVHYLQCAIRCRARKFAFLAGIYIKLNSLYAYVIDVTEGAQDNP